MTQKAADVHCYTWYCRNHLIRNDNPREFLMQMEMCKVRFGFSSILTAGYFGEPTPRIVSKLTTDGSDRWADQSRGQTFQTFRGVRTYTESYRKILDGTQVVQKTMEIFAARNNLRGSYIIDIPGRVTEGTG